MEAINKAGNYLWAAATVDIQLGCEHDCRYCCARHDAVTRFSRCSRQAWTMPLIDAARIDRDYPLYPGPVMFPSTHDITPKNINESLVVMRKLLEAGNEILIVTKPTLACVQLICEALRPWKSKVTYRFTIGSISEEVLAFWEPGAPNYEQRIKSLSCAYYEGYKTSVSCIPYLDAWPLHVYAACEPYLSESFWIGKILRWGSRLDLTGVTNEQLARFVEPLKTAQSDQFVRALAAVTQGKARIRWKDSIQEVTGSPSQARSKHGQSAGVRLGGEATSVPEGPPRYRPVRDSTKKAMHIGVNP
jgi:hypothetical protein